MKQICLVGPVDKRAIAYPLLRTLMFLGRVLIVSDDGVYRRFSEDYSTSFGFENSEFLIAPVIDNTVLNRVKEVESTFDYIVYSTTNEIPEGVDKIIYCCGVLKGFATSEIVTFLENKEYVEVYITFSKLSDTTALKIEPSKGVMSYIFSCEDNKEFLPTQEASYTTMLHRFFETELEISKTTLKSLLARKG